MRATLPRYSEILDGQRLLFADLATRANSAPSSEIADALRADLTFWREVLKNSDYLISRMIAVAALRQHFFYGNLVLREMPAGQAEVIAAWSVPFSVDELSMRRAMAGELAFGEAQMRLWLDGAAEQLIDDPEDVRLTLFARIGSTLARPYYQPQDQTNYFAAAYLDFSKRFEVPLAKYPAAEAEVESLESAGTLVPRVQRDRAYFPVPVRALAVCGLCDAHGQRRRHASRRIAHRATSRSRCAARRDRR